MHPWSISAFTHMYICTSVASTQQSCRITTGWIVISFDLQLMLRKMFKKKWSNILLLHSKMQHLTSPHHLTAPQHLTVTQLAVCKAVRNLAVLSENRHQMSSSGLAGLHSPNPAILPTAYLNSKPSCFRNCTPDLFFYTHKFIPSLWYADTPVSKRSVDI